jgi:hypothetical protein
MARKMDDTTAYSVRIETPWLAMLRIATIPAI